MNDMAVQGPERVYDRAGDPVTYFVYEGTYYSPFPPSKEALPTVRHLENRPSDVILHAYPCSGTHWMWEVLSMLVNGKAERIVASKVSSMLEFCTKEMTDSLPSPRVLNTHLLPRLLPTKMLTENKNIIIYRNIKDTVVSFYRHTHAIRLYEYDGKFSNYLEMFLQGKVDFGSWFDFVRIWEEETKGKPNFLAIYYEDAKRDFLKVIRELADFLELSPDEDLFKKIADLCSFKSMKEEKEEGFGLKPNTSFYRSGVVGTWKNWFTVSESENMDRIYKEKMAGTNIKVDYY